MKKALFFAGLAAATLAFVGCNKEADIKGLDATPFEIVLSEAQTRTLNEGMNTKWAQNDKISLFHAEAGTTDYKNDTPFVEADNKSYPYTISDVENGVFKGTLMGGDLEEGKSYDWYVLYPFNSYLQSPVNTEDGRTYIGGRSDRAQVQSEYDSKAHLAGGSASACFPLYGLAKNIPANEMPTVAMKHVASVAAVTITNDSGSPLKISQVEFTAPEPIVGNFFISFEKEPVTLTPFTEQVSATAVVTVTNPADLAVGETATVYMGIKPFTAAAGDKLSLKITSSAGVLEKELTLTGSVEFRAGTIKHLNVSYSSGTVVPTITVADIKAAITSTSNSNLSEFTGQLSGAVVSFVSGSNAFIQDETGGILYYKSGHGLTAGDVLSGVVTGKGYKYNGLQEITSLAGFEKTSGTAPEPVSMTLADLLADYDRYMSVRVKLTGVTVSGAFANRSTTMTDGDATLTLRDQKNGLSITAGQYDITGHPGYFNANQFGVWAQDDIAISAGANVFDVTERQISVTATATSAQINVTGNVDWTVDPDDNIKSVDPASGNGAGTVTVTFDANTDTENAKEYIVFLRTTASGVEDEIEVTITQEAYDDSDLKYTWDLSAASFASADENAVVWTADMATMRVDKDKANTNANNYLGGANNSSRFYKNSKLTITPVTGITIQYVEFAATTDGYATALATSTWTNAEAAVDDTDTQLVKVTPADGTKAMVAAIGGTCGFTGVTVHYSGTAKALTSISVTGQKTEFTVGDTFTHDTAVVTATYSDNSQKDVTASATFSAPEMATAGTKEVTVSYTEGVTKTTSYNITVSAPTTLTVSQAVVLADDATGTVGDAIVAAICTKGFIATDGTQNVYVFMNKQPDVALGDKVSFSFKKTTYFGLPELTTIDNLTVASHDNTIPRTTLIDITSTLDTYSSSETDYLTVTGTLVKSGNYYNVTVTGATRYATPMYLSGIDPSTLVDQQVIMTGYFNTINTGKGAVQFIATEIKAADANVKYCVVEPEVLNVAAAATSATLSIQANAAWTVTSDNSAFTVSPASGSADATVTISFAANTTAENKVANITVACPDASVTKVVVLTQSGVVTGGDELTAADFAAISTSYADFSGVSKSSGAVYAGNTAKTNDGAIQLRSNNSNSGIVSTTSGGKAKKVVIEWNSATQSGRTLDVYGKASAYSAATDLYSNDTKGTKIGSVVMGTSTELIISGDYQYIGLRSNNNSMYIDKITIVWE